MRRADGKDFWEREIFTLAIVGDIEAGRVPHGMACSALSDVIASIVITRNRSKEFFCIFCCAEGVKAYRWSLRRGKRARSKCGSKRKGLNNTRRLTGSVVFKAVALVRWPSRHLVAHRLRLGLAAADRHWQRPSRFSVVLHVRRSACCRAYLYHRRHWLPRFCAAHLSLFRPSVPRRRSTPLMLLSYVQG